MWTTRAGFEPLCHVRGIAVDRWAFVSPPDEVIHRSVVFRGLGNGEAHVSEVLDRVRVRVRILQRAGGLQYGEAPRHTSTTKFTSASPFIGCCSLNMRNNNVCASTKYMLPKASA